MHRLTLILILSLTSSLAAAAEPSPASRAVPYRAGQPVTSFDGVKLVCEAEEFQPDQTGGWQAKPWGDNYYCATFANSFLSRKAFLGAPEQCTRSVATLDVEVPTAGRYLALIRYEACYRFETQFRLVVEQGGAPKLDRLYGARENLKVWAFREKLKKEVAWSWGADENVVWEGHDAAVELGAGRATLKLIADRQPGDAARRHVDVIVLTSDAADVASRIEKENYLPLDGLLTQAGDLHVKIGLAADSDPVSVTIPHGTEHSPYWVHLRTWKPKVVAVKPGETTDWIEVGSVLDSLNDGQWTIQPAPAAKGKGGKPPRCSLEFGLRESSGTIVSIRRFEPTALSVTLAYDADTRYTRRIRLQEEILDELLAAVKARPLSGAPPRQTLIYGYTFDRRTNPEDARWNAKVDEFRRLYSLAATDGEAPAAGTKPSGYLDVRGVPTNQLEKYCQKLQADGKAERIAVISLGDEIGLARPPRQDHAGFRAWLKGQNLQPTDVDPSAGTDWEKVNYAPDPKTAQDNPRRYVWSRRYADAFGIKALKERTDILRRYLPNAGIGANYSPHHHHLYLGDVAQWVDVFRQEAMTMPWGEDYIWQVPVGTPQMNALCLDLFRAGLRGKPTGKIHYYVMPHTPGNLTTAWRRQFYLDLGHGMKIVNLFEFRPVQVAYTENHCSDPAMFVEIRKSFHELTTFEDLIQTGQVQPATTGLWFSGVADLWDDYHGPFAAAKRTLYILLKHQQLPVDFVIEDDALDGTLKHYRSIFLADRHISQKASRALAEWVKAGGRLYATAGAGLRDEFDQPNRILGELLGVEEQELVVPEANGIRFEKQDLPFAEPLAQVELTNVKGGRLPVFGARSRLKAAGAQVSAKYTDGTPAVTRHQVGSGLATCVGWLPGLSYFHSAIPRRPVDRGAVEDSMAHFLPTNFHPAVIELLEPDGMARPAVHCSAGLVETAVVDAPQGQAIMVIDWSGKPSQQVTITRTGQRSLRRQVALASGGPVTVKAVDGGETYTFELRVADALILRGEP